MSEKHTDVCSQPGIAFFFFLLLFFFFFLGGGVLSLGTRKQQISAESRSCSSSTSHFHRLSVVKVSFPSLMKGITPKIHMLCFSPNK